MKRLIVHLNEISLRSLSSHVLRLVSYVLLMFFLLFHYAMRCSHGEPLKSPNLGRVISEQALMSYEITVMPNGTGLPSGYGTVTEGKKIYTEKCMSCHGQGGIGDSGEQLAGAIHALTDAWPEKTIGTYWPYVTTLFDFTRRSMPMTQPGSLTNNQTYALVAYMLFLNQLIAEDIVLDADTLMAIELPNRNGFIDVYPIQ